LNGHNNSEKWDLKMREEGSSSRVVVGGIPFTHAEVKRVERLDLYTAIRKAIDDAGNDAIPYVAHRRNRSEWLVTVRSQDLIPMANAIIEALGLEIAP